MASVESSVVRRAGEEAAEGWWGKEEFDPNWDKPKSDQMEDLLADKKLGVCGNRQNDEHFWQFMHMHSKIQFMSIFNFEKEETENGWNAQWITDAIYYRYKYKARKLIDAVEEVAEKTRVKKNSMAHWDSSKVRKVVERMRGFEKCRGMETDINKALVANVVIDTTNSYPGFHFGGGTQEETEEEKNANWISDTEAVRFAVPDDRDEAAAEREGYAGVRGNIVALEELWNEGDSCCREDCTFADANAKICVPCAPVAAKSGLDYEDLFDTYFAYNNGEWCFERCHDSCEAEDQGTERCDCMTEPECEKEGIKQEDCKVCRVCRGMKSLARYAAKEVKITLSFDQCPKLATMYPDTPQREKLSRQTCGIFDPARKCHVNLDKVFMRGGPTEHMTQAQGLSAVFGGTGCWALADAVVARPSRREFFFKRLMKLDNTARDKNKEDPPKLGVSQKRGLEILQAIEELTANRQTDMLENDNSMESKFTFAVQVYK